MQRTHDPVAFVHTAAFYRGEREYLEAVLPFVADGLANGGKVQVVVPTDKLALLRSVLGQSADGVEMADMAVVGRNPANIFTKFAAALPGGDPGRRMWVVAEPVWPGRGSDAYPACVQNEALFNTAFAGTNVATLCPYDAAELPDEVLADARRTHPLIRERGRDVACPEYAWRQMVAEFNQPLDTHPEAATYQISELGNLSAARSFAAEHARAFGLPADRVGDLHLIVTELATNSLKYSGSGCRLAMWVRDGRLICEVRDGGRLDDPMAGRRTPAADSTTGRGLLLVNALADLVRMHTSEADTTIQVHLL